MLHIYSRFRGHFSCLTTDASSMFTTEETRERPEDDEIFSSNNNVFNSQIVGSSSSLSQSRFCIVKKLHLPALSKKKNNYLGIPSI